jgi:AraC-like DNA-binding protein
MYYEKDADVEGHFLFAKYTREKPAYYNSMPHYHSSVEIFIGSCGRFLVYVGGEQRQISEGDIAFADGHTPHTCGVAELSEDFEAFVIVASTAYFDKKRICTDRIAPFTPRKDGYQKILDFVRLAYTMKDSMNHEMRLGFVNMLLGMISMHCKTDASVQNKTTQLTVEIMRYIDTCYAEDISLSSLSKKFGYEATYLSRIFNRHAGVNLREYINRTRYSATRKMIAENPGLSVADASHACGFASPKTYYRAAKRIQDEEKHNF